MPQAPVERVAGTGRAGHAGGRAAGRACAGTGGGRAGRRRRSPRHRRQHPHPRRSPSVRRTPPAPPKAAPPPPSRRRRRCRWCRRRSSWCRRRGLRRRSSSACWRSSRQARASGPRASLAADAGAIGLGGDGAGGRGADLRLRDRIRAGRDHVGGARRSRLHARPRGRRDLGRTLARRQRRRGRRRGVARRPGERALPRIAGRRDARAEVAARRPRAEDRRPRRRPPEGAGAGPLALRPRGARELRLGARQGGVPRAHRGRGRARPQHLARRGRAHRRRPPAARGAGEVAALRRGAGPEGADADARVARAEADPGDLRPHAGGREPPAHRRRRQRRRRAGRSAGLGRRGAAGRHRAGPRPVRPPGRLREGRARRPLCRQGRVRSEPRRPAQAGRAPRVGAVHDDARADRRDAGGRAARPAARREAPAPDPHRRRRRVDAAGRAESAGRRRRSAALAQARRDDDGRAGDLLLRLDQRGHELRPWPRALASASDWCTASPISVGTARPSARWV